MSGFPPLRGDEDELIRSYTPVLERRLARMVNTSAANREDAIAFAWTVFLRRQPDALTTRCASSATRPCSPPPEPPQPTCTPRAPSSAITAAGSRRMPALRLPAETALKD